MGVLSARSLTELPVRLYITADTVGSDRQHTGMSHWIQSYKLQVHLCDHDVTQNMDAKIQRRHDTMSCDDS